MGSSISLKTPQPTGYNKLIGFAFCVVVACSVSECCRHESVEDDRKCNLFDVVCDRRSKGYDSYTSSYLGKISHVESDHMFLGSSTFDGENSCKRSDEFFFHIDRSCCEVKKCGIHFVHAQDSTD